MYGLSNSIYTAKLYEVPGEYCETIDVDDMSPYIISPTNTFKHLFEQSTDFNSVFGI